MDGFLGVQSEEAGRELTTSEIIFLGTGTSEGIPRVSCLTNPDKSCPVSPLGFLYSETTVVVVGGGSHREMKPSFWVA